MNTIEHELLEYLILSLEEDRKSGILKSINGYRTSIYCYYILQNNGFYCLDELQSFSNKSFIETISLVEEALNEFVELHPKVIEKIEITSLLKRITSTNNGEKSPFIRIGYNPLLRTKYAYRIQASYLSQMNRNGNHYNLQKNKPSLKSTIKIITENSGKDNEMIKSEMVITNSIENIIKKLEDRIIDITDKNNGKSSYITLETLSINLQIYFLKRVIWPL